MPQLRTLVRAWGIFSCLLEIARAKTKNIEITVFFVFDIRNGVDFVAFGGHVPSTRGYAALTPG